MDENIEWNQVVLPQGLGPAFNPCGCEMETLHYAEPAEGWCIYVKELPAPPDMPEHLQGRMQEEFYGEEEMPAETPPPFPYYVRWGTTIVAQGELPELDSAKAIALEVFGAARKRLRGAAPGVSPVRLVPRYVHH